MGSAYAYSSLNIVLYVSRTLAIWEHGTKYKVQITVHENYSQYCSRARLLRGPCRAVQQFQGRHGRAYLLSNVVNVTLGPREERVLITGLHTVADIHCTSCNAVIGWKYVRAHKPQLTLPLERRHRLVLRAHPLNLNLSTRHPLHLVQRRHRLEIRHPHIVKFQPGTKHEAAPSGMSCPKLGQGLGDPAVAWGLSLNPGVWAYVCCAVGWNMCLVASRHPADLPVI